MKTKDRVGIAHELLAVFAERSWDLRAVEVGTGVTFVDIDEGKLSIMDIRLSLAKVPDFVSCRQIDFLPSQEREAHLQALLSKLPDAVIDVNAKGEIIARNEAAVQLAANEQTTMIGSHIDGLIEPRFEQIMASHTQSGTETVALNFAGVETHADVSPVYAENRLNGALFTLRTMKALGRQLSLLQSEPSNNLSAILGESSAILQIKEQTLRYAELDLPVFISGETGTGKELVARAIHDGSSRASEPFLAINCAALPENLLESELYGYTQGAFTGAQKGGKPGLFELAEGGTIFLDEVAEMSPYLQAKLLRFLQDFKFRRLGGTKEEQANVRIVSASHQPLSEMIAKNSFREDLFYRLNVLTLSLPPLRERGDDIILLAKYFVENSALQVNQQQPELSASALEELTKHTWPGNVRQLQNVLFKIVALNETGLISNEEVASALMKNSAMGEQGNVSGDSLPNYLECTDWQSAQQQFERQLLSALLPLYPTTRKLAQRLNVSHNKIAMKLRACGLSAK